MTKAPMLCYNDKNCWCKDVRIHANTLQLLKKKYKGCLGRKALESYAGK